MNMSIHNHDTRVTFVTENIFRFPDSVDPLDPQGSRHVTRPSGPSPYRRRQQSQYQGAAGGGGGGLRFRNDSISLTQLSSRIIRLINVH